MKKLLRYTAFIVLHLSFIISRSQQIPCLTNSFWSIGLFAPIYQYTLTGDSVYIIGEDSVHYGESYMASLAYCNNLNGGAISPTFYGSFLDNRVFYQDTGNVWVQIPQTSSWPTPNCGGNGDYLYFLDNPDTLPNVIFKYDGHSFTNVFIDSTLFITVADLSVDDNGNVYFFEGDSLILNKWLTVISPTGTILKRYNFPIANTTGYDGSFLMNGILYVDIDEPGGIKNNLLPIAFTPDSAIAQPLIVMPFTQYLRADFAGCNAGIPTAIANILPAPPLTIKVFPNPAGNFVNIEMPPASSFTIFNLLGQEMYQTKAGEKTIRVNVTDFSAGLYFISAKNGSEMQVEKFLVQH